jgi:hypothetical protein
MERPKAEGFTVTESWRMTIRCIKQSNGRILVKAWDSPGQKDSRQVRVAWDFALSVTENYAEAVRVYLRGTDWDGEWAVSTCPDGAVAVYVPGTAGY